MVNLGYARLSREAQAEGDTLDNHISRLQAIPCDQIFHDLQSGWKGKSGDNSADRDGFQELIQLAKKLRNDNLQVKIYFGRVDRWGRSVETNIAKVEELESIGCELFSLDTGQVSTQTAGQWLNLSQQSVFSEYWSRQLSDNIAAAYDRKRKLNKPLVARPPLGYKLSYDKSKLEYDDNLFKESKITGYEIAVELVALYQSGLSSKKCAIHAAKYGCKFQSNSFNRWLKNPTLRGHLWYYDPPRNKAKKIGVTSEKVIIANTHDPIITPDQWSIIKIKLDDSYSLRGKNQRKTYPLQRLCKCAFCKSTLFRNVNTRGNYSWESMRCTNVHCTRKTMSVNKIENEIILAIQSKSVELQSAYAQPVKTDKLPAEVIALSSQREEIQKLYDKSPIEGLRIALVDIDNRIKEISENNEPVDSIPLEQLLDLAEAVADTDSWKKLSDEPKRVIYQALVKQVVVDLSEKTAVVELSF